MNAGPAPIAAIFRYSLPSGLKSLAVSANDWKRYRKYHKTMTALRVSARKVAHAAPRIPQPNPKINSASSATFTRDPVTMQAREKFGDPSARIRNVPSAPITAHTKEREVIRAYSIAYGITVSVQPNNTRSCWVHRSIGTVTSNPHRIIRPKPPPTHFFASSNSPFPRWRFMALEEPTPHIRDSAEIKVTAGNTTFVAAFPTTPRTFPMKIWSTIL